MWLFDGYNLLDIVDFPFICNNEVWSSADGVTWKCNASTAAWSPRQYHSIAVSDNRLWVLAGWNA